MPRIDRSCGASVRAGYLFCCMGFAISTPLTVCAASASPPTPIASSSSTAFGAIDEARLAAADREPQNWYTGGRDQDGTYYSPLADITAANVGRLGFAWTYDLGAPQRGQEATPIVVDGVMYTSGTWGYVYALDAATGKELWRYDPKADPFAGRQSVLRSRQPGRRGVEGQRCTSPLPTGVCMRSTPPRARRSGKSTPSSTIRCPIRAPARRRSPGTSVVIGNGGGDMSVGGVRGYVSAYALDTGAFKWRFFTVPPAPGQPLENPDLCRGREDLGPASRPEIQGRRHGLGRLRLRSRPEAGLFRDRQCRAL